MQVTRQVKQKEHIHVYFISLNSYNDKVWLFVLYPEQKKMYFFDTFS